MQNQTEQTNTQPSTEVVSEKPVENAEPIFRVKVKSSIKGGKAPIQSCT